MSTLDLPLFLRDLWLQGVEFWLEGDQLRFRGSKNLINGDTLALLRDNKPAIIDIIRAAPQAYLGFPLSHGQRSIYLMQNLAPQSAAYNLACLFKTGNDLNLGVLENSLDFLLQRHAPLRVSIETLDGHLAQQVSYSLPSILNVTRVDILGETQLLQWAKQQADQPFNLASEPLIRARLLINNSTANCYLLLVTHHIIADFWAMDLLIKELAIIYQAGLTDSTPELPEIGKLYKDYVIQERQWLTSAQGEAARQYWLEKLVPLPPALELPTDLKRPQQQSFKGKEHRFALGHSLTAQLKELARQQHVTAFIWVLSAFQTLLHRYTGENRIAIGSPMACRMQHDFQLLAGHFTNPVVLTSDFSKNADFTALLNHNKEQLLQAIKYQEYPLQCLIEALHSQRENPNTALFQTAISWNQASDSQRSSNSLVDRILLTEQRGAIYDLVLTGYDQGDYIELSIRFNTDIFKDSSIARMAGHLCTLIEQTCTGNNPAIGHIDFRSAAEKSQLADINNTGSTIPANTSLARLFRDTAQQYPQFSALKDGDKHYSYAELETRSNRMAHYLYAQGIKPGDHITLCLYRSRDMLVLILAALKCGCTYIPIDTAYPNDRIAYMAMQSQAPLLVSSQQLTGKLSELATQAPDTTIRFIEQINAALDNFSDSFDLYNNGECEENAIACVLYTSGSTGRPKGVKTPHRAIIRLCKNTNLFSLKPAEKFCYLSNISFDATNLEIWGSFLNGGCLLKVDNDTLLSPQNFAEFIEREKPQAALITTALFNVFISYQPGMFRNMNYIFVGGEALDINPVRRCIEHGKPAHLINIYGPTENGTISTIYEVNDARIQVIPIGKPISNSQVYVHDRYGKPAPLGVMGEIFVGGEGISTGYMKQAELTAEKFIADHYRGKGLLYATGDLGYLREDGELMYAGRRDDQVKIRGYRIELGEIEQCLSLHPHINECCVVVNKDTDIATLHAYYSADITLDSATVKTFLRQSLPEFMIPSATLQMQAMPINANGKVDKRQLPAIKAEKQHGHAAPRNACEQAIATIWQQQLHIDSIGIHDHFFEIGGHSLLAIRVASAIQDELYTEVPMRLLFEHPTIASLAEAILRNTSNNLPEITACTDDNDIPAALSQQRLWFLQQLNPASRAYNMPVALRIVKPLDAAHLQACLQTLIQRHDALRTTFTDTNGIARLRIHDVVDWHLPQVDLSHLADTLAEAQAKNALAELAQHTFDLENELLFKSLLIRLAPDEYILAFCLHHIIADGLTVDILLRELVSLWQQPSANLAGILPAPAIRYADFSAWQHRYLQGELLETQLAYWQQQLAGAPTLLDLPTDKPRPAVLGYAGASHEFTIPAHTATRLKTLSQHNGATLFMTLLAAYSLLLSRYSQQNDLCIGFPIAGRTQKSLENIVGLFVNNLVVRCNLADNVSVNDYIQQIKHTTINAYAHQDIPFDMIVDALKTERSLSHIPFLQASFSLENSHFAEKIATVMGSDVRHETLDWHIAKYDLHLSCFETGGQHLTATLDYNTELFEAATIEKISRHYLALLNAMTENPHTSIDDIAFLSELEYQQQMDFNNGWNATAYDYPQAQSLHELIEQQAAATPHATALIDDNTRLSYEELNIRSNRLAHYLRTLGVTRNQPVAICLERSIHMSVALLAILKAGGAYVPLTTDIPASRINFICNDTGTRVFISTTAQTFDNLDIRATRINADDSQAWQAFSASNPEAITQKNDLFNIIYTSGSTGTPKGVMVPHRGIINRLRWMQHAYPIGLHDRVLQKTPFNFDVSVWELFWPLMQGSTLVFAKAEGHKDPDYLRDLIIHHGITTLHFVPSMLGVFLQTADIEQCRSIKYLFASGEALQPGHCQSFFQRLPQAGLFNLYGPTEASIDVSFYNCTAQETHSSIAIGKPIHNTQLHILDKNLKVLPIGVAGDLYIGGEGLALGYWNQEELTRATFIENPWFAKGHPSKRLYKTGDVARYRSDGNIEYLGRSDHQIKIRGLRVELGEIETAISKLPGITECIVVLKNTDADKQRLVAYLLTGNSSLDTTTIATTLKASLPEYMVPAAFVCLQEWPLSANGKIDRKRLPAPHSSTNNFYEAPRNATEQTLAEIWQNLLDAEKIGIHDNFFELGGHSLLATQMASRIRTALACSLELKAIFEHPTIAELAIHLLEQEMRTLDMDDADLLAMLNEIEN